MNRQDTIHRLLNLCTEELLTFIKETESEFNDRWVPSATIKKRLKLNLPAVPVKNKQYGSKGWVFGTLARMLEDAGRVEHKKEANNRSFYRSKNQLIFFIFRKVFKIFTSFSSNLKFISPLQQSEGTGSVQPL